MSLSANGVARFTATLEQTVGVLREKRGHATWIMFGDQRAARAGGFHSTAGLARVHAETLLNALALALVPVVQTLLAEAKCDCPCHQRSEGGAE